MEQFFLEKNALICFRTMEQKEALIFFPDKVKSIQAICQRLKTLEVEKIYVYVSSDFKIVYSYIATMLVQPHRIKIREIESHPSYELTKYPQTVPVTLSDEMSWKNIRELTVLPIHGWDFYDLQWILKRWEASLGIFDYDEFLITPSYPKDAYNEIIHPDLFFFTVEHFVQKYSLEQLQQEYYAIYLLTKDSTGKAIFRFFYDETFDPAVTKKTLFQRLHRLYHEIEESHPYRIFTFFRNNTISSKQQFKITLFVQQYLSFYGMFCSFDFVKERKTYLKRGIDNKFMYFRQFFETSVDIEKEFQLLFYDKNYRDWIGKHHLVPILETSPFWKYMYDNWDNIDRNVSIWDSRVLTYQDSQLSVGGQIKSWFPREWALSFHKEDFIPQERLSKRVKRKL